MRRLSDPFLSEIFFCILKAKFCQQLIKIQHVTFVKMFAVVVELISKSGHISEHSYFIVVVHFHETSNFTSLSVSWTNSCGKNFHKHKLFSAKQQVITMLTCLLWKKLSLLRDYF